MGEARISRSAGSIVEVAANHADAAPFPACRSVHRRRWLAQKTFRSRSDAAWQQRLSPAAYQVLRREGTERPFSSPLKGEKRAGTYHCAGCDQPLFSSAAKYDSGTGWSSFWQPLPDALGTRIDFKLIVPRTEYRGRRCGGHQGHVFDDGPLPTGKYYCNNGVALRFCRRRAEVT